MKEGGSTPTAIALETLSIILTPVAELDYSLKRFKPQLVISLQAPVKSVRSIEQGKKMKHLLSLSNDPH